MAEALNNVDKNKEVNQTPEQKTEQAIQDIKKESRQEDINKLFEKNFLDNLLQETALKLLNIINSLGMKDSELPKDLKDLKDVLEPKAAKIQSFGEKNNFISDSAEDLARKERKLIKTITKEIEKLSPQINDSNTKGILNQINNIVNNLNGQNKAQLTDFLERNGITNIDRTDNTSILNGVTEFLNKIDKLITDKKESDAVLQEREANKTKFTEFFNEIIKPKQRNKLDKYNYRDYLDPICTFIQQSPRDTNVIEAYLQMKQININNQNNVHWSDKEWFKTFFGTLENLYGKDKPYNEKAAQQFWGQKFDQRSKNYTIIDIATKGIGLQNWDGKNLNLNDSTQKTQIEKLVNNMGGASFDTKYFVDKFNKLNQGRIDNNEKQLKNFDIISVLGEELKKINKDDNGNLTIKTGEGVDQPLTTENMIQLLGLDEKAKVQLKKNPGETNFVNENELINLIKTNTEIQQERYNKILKKVQERQEAAQAESETQNPTQLDGEGTPETQTEKLEELLSTDITNLYSRNLITTEQVADFFNEAIKKSDLSEEQTSLLLLAKKGLTTKRGENDDIKTLQGKLGGLKVDGKFGKNTFIALKEALGYETPKTAQGNKNIPTNNNNTGGDITSRDNTKSEDVVTNDSSNENVESDENSKFKITTGSSNFGSRYNIEGNNNTEKINDNLYREEYTQLINAFSTYHPKSSNGENYYWVNSDPFTGPNYSSNPLAWINCGKHHNSSGSGSDKGDFTIKINFHDFQNDDGSLDTIKIRNELDNVKKQREKEKSIQDSKNYVYSQIKEFSLNDLGLNSKANDAGYKALMNYFEDGKIKIDKKWTLPTRNANGDLIFDLDPKGRGNCPDYFRGITISRKDLVDNETGKYDLDKFKSAFGEKIIGIVNDNIL